MSTVILLFLAFFGNANILEKMAKIGGQQTGNGGDVVYCKDHPTRPEVELLDLFEAKFEGFNIIHPVETEDVKKMAKEYLELGLGDRFSLLLPELLPEIDSFFENVKFVDSTIFELEDIRDSWHVVLPKGCQIKQIAIQRPTLPGTTKYIVNRQLWDKLPKVERAMLVNHEVIFKLILKHGATNSVALRNFNGLIISGQVDKYLSSDEIVFDFLRDHLPMDFVAKEGFFLNYDSVLNPLFDSKGNFTKIWVDWEKFKLRSKELTLRTDFPLGVIENMQGRASVLLSFNSSGTGVRIARSPARAVDDDWQSPFGRSEFRYNFYIENSENGKIYLIGKEFPEDEALERGIGFRNSDFFFGRNPKVAVYHGNGTRRSAEGEFCTSQSRLCHNFSEIARLLEADYDFFSKACLADGNYSIWNSSFQLPYQLFEQNQMSATELNMATYSCKDSEYTARKLTLHSGSLALEQVNSVIAVNSVSFDKEGRIAEATSALNEKSKNYFKIGTGTFGLRLKFNPNRTVSQIASTRGTFPSSLLFEKEKSFVFINYGKDGKAISAKSTDSSIEGENVRIFSDHVEIHEKARAAYVHGRFLVRKAGWSKFYLSGTLKEFTLQGSAKLLDSQRNEIQVPAGTRVSLDENELVIGMN